MSDERWRWVEGYEGLYMVSDKGRVMGTPKKTHYGHILAQKETSQGYMSVCLFKEGATKYFSVHRLVASAFISNPKSKREINHKDGDKKNNCVDNLEWVTRSENEKHAYGVLGKKPNRPWAGKPRKFARKFTDEQIRAIREDDRPMRVIGSELGVSKTAIRDIKTKKNYAEVL